jgi:branched-chain amino acid transport system ATP-binding protein
MAPVLTLDGISSGYGDLPVLDHVSLSVEEGEIYSILGANGAGKTTLLRTIAGALKTRTGSITFNGQSLTGIASHKIIAQGIALVPEGRKLFPYLTVEENLRLGAYHSKARANWHQTLGEMYEMFPRLSERKHQNAGSLSGGEQQMCAIARGLMSQPKMLLLDEPSLGLAPIVVAQVFELIAELPKRGLTVLLVEQNVVEALSLSARGSVMENGRLVVHGSAEELLNNPQVREAYLGVA